MSISLSEPEIEAQQKIDRFVRRFEPSYRHLAYLAALPLILTPELVNYLRVKFLRGKVPWIAEADLLLSDLCRQIGYEQYAMDTVVRNCLLHEMKERKGGKQRMQEVAKLLISYVRYLGKTSTFLSYNELHAQKLSAMLYVDDFRKDAVRQLAEEFAKAIDKIDKSELARLSGLTKELAPQLSKSSELIKYANLVSEFIKSPEQVATLDNQQGDQTFRVEDIKFVNPYKIIDPKKIKILFLVFDPEADLQINRKVKDLHNAIKRFKNYEQFELKIEYLVLLENLQNLVYDNKPYLVHFFGPETGAERLSNQVLSELCKIVKDNVECVFLSNYYTKAQAETINKHIKYVIAINQEIKYDTANAFSVGFYEALSDGETIERAYKFGCNRILLDNPDFPEHLKPILYEKNDVDPIISALEVIFAKIAFDGKSKTPQPSLVETVSVKSSEKVINIETNQSAYDEKSFGDNIPIELLSLEVIVARIAFDGESETLQ